MTVFFKIRSSFYVCCYGKDENIVIKSLKLLDTIICYNHLPPQSLPIFIATLCHTANSRNHCSQCWKVNQVYCILLYLYMCIIVNNLFCFIFNYV